MKRTRPTLEELMRSVNSTSWPTRWAEIYDDVMDDFEKNGCILTDPDYYDEIGKRYGILVEFREDYKRAAVEVAKDEALSRVLALICDTMRHRETAMSEANTLELPHSTDGSYEIKYEMLTALAMAYMADYTYLLLAERGLPQHQIDYAMNVFDGMIKTYKARNDGRAGAMSWAWYQLGVDAKLFDMGRLQIEMGAKFPARATIFENSQGETLALAHNVKLHRSGYILGSAKCEDEDGSWEPTLVETDSAYIGYAYDKYGAVKNEKIALEKSEWKKLIEPNAPMIALHIPPVSGMTPELIDKAFADTTRFAAKYYPEFEYKGFICGSWLMDAQLIDLLGEEKNISKFCKRFERISAKSSGRSVFSFVFLQTDVNDVDLSSLSENTSLERALKKHYLNGGVIYELYGYIPKNKI